MVSEDYKRKKKKFKKDMLEAKKTLPLNWVQILLKNKELKINEHKKMYNMLTNWLQGRSYSSSLKFPKLVIEIIDLSSKYKELEL